MATATGVLIPGSIASINAPADFNDNPTLTSLGGNVSGPDFANVLLDDLAIDVPDESLDYMAKSSQEGGFIDPPLKRQPDIVVAGQPAYHLAGKDVAFNSWADEYGFRYQGHDITVVISTPLDMPQAERDALAAPVLASLTLQG
ncbi:MAG: hypothetical protein LH468_11820 [Nocardioides sp.]|nr:hypothetical protein [Nocardioides sp.]